MNKHLAWKRISYESKIPSKTRSILTNAYIYGYSFMLRECARTLKLGKSTLFALRGALLRTIGPGMITLGAATRVQTAV